jgi:hypothetical protein
MRRWLCFTVLTATTLCQAQVKLALTIGGKKAGTASLSQKLNADGSKLVELHIDMLAGGQKARLTSQSSYDAKGNPTRKFLQAIVPGGKVQRQTVVTFDAEGANVVVLTGDARQTKKVPLVETAPRALASEFWFVRDKPKPGDKAKGYGFNADTLAWDLVETTYLGLRTVNVGGKKISAHMLESDQGGRRVFSFLDDKGLPWLIDDGRIKMERIQEK